MRTSLCVTFSVLAPPAQLEPTTPCPPSLCADGLAVCLAGRMPAPRADGKLASQSLAPARNNLPAVATLGRARSLPRGQSARAASGRQTCKSEPRAERSAPPVAHERRCSSRTRKAKTRARAVTVLLFLVPPVGLEPTTP